MTAPLAKLAWLIFTPSMKILKLLGIALSFIFPLASQAGQSVDLTTPRGAAIKLEVYNPGESRALLLGPGQGCNARLDLYESLAREAKAAGTTLVRIYWAYCVASPNGSASDDLSLEKEDFQTALGYVEGVLGFSADKISIGGKSLGSFVSSDIFQLRKDLPSLVLLTPVCTDSSVNPRRNVFAENYPYLTEETRPVLLAQGNADPLCDTSHFQEFFLNKANNFSPAVFAGDHGLGIKNADGTYNADLGARNMTALGKWLFTWL